METELVQKKQQQKKKKQGRNESNNRNLILLCLTLIYLAVLKQDVMFTPVAKSKLSANSRLHFTFSYTLPETQSSTTGGRRVSCSV